MKRKKTNRMGRGKQLLLLATQMALLGTRALASRLCEGVAFMPTELVLTRAKDQPGLTDEYDRSVGLVDVHTFNHFYTFQVDRDINERNEGLVMDLINDRQKAATSDGYAFRLRAEFNSAEASRAGMGFRVMLSYKVRDQTGYYLETVAEMTSLNTEEGEGTVSIDIPDLPAGRDYQLRYEFGQKEVLRKHDSLSMEEDSVATSDSVVNCNLPFFTQELVLVDRKALKTRIKKYNQDSSSDELDINKHSICDFSRLDGENEGGEYGLSCTEHVYNYPIAGPKSVLHVDESGFALREVASYPFRVSGEHGEPITQLFKMTLGTEFAVGAGMRAILRRTDGVLNEYDTVHPFACLLDQSCQFAWRQSKNHHSFQVVLTTGNYIFQIFDLSKESYTTMLSDDVQLSAVPFSIYIESYPILQNEVRGHCPFMFLMEDFIQQKYIDGQSGQKFHFADKVVMNLYEQQQKILIVPELDSTLKVVIREAFGVNAMINLCEHDSKNGEINCFHSGTQIGTTEILSQTGLKQDTEYVIIIDYSHSILAFHKFEECPHLPIEISMISESESQLVNNSRAADLGITDKSSRTNLKEIFKRMNYVETVTVDDPHTEGSFVLTSKSDADFEVLASYDFQVSLKMGLFLEIFYSPYDDEVMELYLAERYDLLANQHVQADTSDQYDNDDKDNKRVFQMNRYKSAKTIWVDLEPGEYTIQIINKRQPQESSSSFYQKANFQLYMKYDVVNVPREAFLPGHLNYHGLLGVGDETHDFGHVTLFWDDLTLWHKKLSTLFIVESHMTSFSIQLEQATDLCKMHLLMMNEETKLWEQVGIDYPEVTELGRIDTIEELSLISGNLYKIELFKDSFSEHAQIEEVEMGERYGTSFSIKIDFSEFDDQAIVDNANKNMREFLPLNMHQVAKEKRSVQGLHEKSFMMGNRNMIHLIEYGDGWQDMVLIPPYVPKETRIFTSKQSEDTIVTSLPFEVTGLEEIIYAGLYEYTQGANLMSLHIIDDETHEEVAISQQGKHLSLISGTYLPQGNYYLVVKNDRAIGKGSYRGSPLRFVLDVVRHQVPEDHEYILQQLEAIQLCQLPHSPESGLTRPGYLHLLSGNSMQQVLNIGVLELDSGSTTIFTLTEDSFVSVYVETAEDIPVALEIIETGGVRKAIALSSDQDRIASNFLHQEGFKERNVVQLREFLAAGAYWIHAKAINEDVLVNFDQRETFCDTFTMVITINPLKSATETFSLDTEEEFCEEVDPLVNQLKVDGMVKANLVRELGQYGAEVGYFDFDSDDTEGPYLIYFQLDYDMSQEGVMAIVVSQYDRDLSSFTEVGLYSISDSQSTVLQIVEKGTYSISIQSIVSTSNKFQQLGISRSKLIQMPILTSHCFRAVYTYMVSSANEHDASMSSFAASFRETRVRVMETIDDMRNLREFSTCRHSEMPTNFPVSDEGFEREYTFMVSNSAKKAIGLIIEEPSLVRIVINARNPANQVHAQVLNPGSVDSEEHPISKTDAVHNSLLTVLEPDRKPYIVRLVQGQMDYEDPCPVYDFHIAVKPLRSVVQENLSCMGHQAPPAEFEITEKTTKLDVTCAFSDEMIMDAADSGQHGIMTYDMLIDLPHSDFFFDIELKNDFLTGNFRMYLFAMNTETNSWQKIANSVWFDENSYDDIAIDAEALMSTKIGDKTMIQKLRYLEDAPKEVLDNASKLLLRLRVNVMDVINTLQHMDLYNPRVEDLCFNFDISLFADEVSQGHLNDNDDNKLIRVDWRGQEQSVQRLDASARITAFLEFEKSMARHVPNLKSSFQESIYLEPLDKDGKPDKTLTHVIPSHFKLKHSQDDVVVLAFSPYTLEKNTCYRLKFNFLPNSQYQSISQMITPQVADSFDLKICTSGCECDTQGTQECLEAYTDFHVCKCHAHFIGDDCSVCEDGYYRNGDGFCEKDSLCAEMGGQEDCNGHGTCNQYGDVAVCECDAGFTNDGLDQCSRCKDPLMKFPYECANVRNWVLETDDFECDTLMNQMPRTLYKDPNASKGVGLHHQSQVVYQQPSGVLEWAGRYSLIKPDHQHKHEQKFLRKDNAVDVDNKFRKESSHKFFVRNTSVYKLYINTLDSNVKVKYTIKNHEQEVVKQTHEFLGDVTAFGMLIPVDRPEDALEKPFTLIVQYEHEHSKNDIGGSPDCPKVEIHLVVEPANFHQESIECTKDELDFAKTQEIEKEFIFKKDKVMIEQRIVMPHHWFYDVDKHPNNLFRKTEESDHKAGNIDFKLDVKRAGVFGFIVATDFSDLNVFLSLKNIDTKSLIGIDKSYMLDNVETSNDHYANMKDMGLARRHGGVEDHLSAIEIGHLEEGRYILTIQIPRAHFMQQELESTCLTMKVMMDFIPKDKQSSDEDGFTQLDGPVDITSVYPPSRNDLEIGSEMNMMIHLSRPIDVRDAARSMPDVATLCRLQNMVDSKKYITPHKYFYDQDYAKLNFDFAKQGDYINQVFKDNKKRDAAACWRLACKDSPSKDGELYFEMEVGEQQYCFAGLGDDASVFMANKDNCNPFAKAKQKKNGDCVCTFPYEGSTCEKCDSNYLEEKHETYVDGRSETHTVCAPKADSDAYECNGFGKYDRNSRICKCMAGFAGDYCEMCEEPDAEYPECGDEYEALFMESSVFDGFNQQRREQVYHSDYHLENTGSPFQQQCQHTDFPNYLNSISNHKEFSSGDFHIADIFRVNHDYDNVIEFTPRSPGLFKILVKQPQMEMVTQSDESMHFEIGVVRADGTGTMKTESNHIIDYNGKAHGGHTVIDFSVLEFGAHKDLIGEPLHIYFRGVNMTHDSGYMEPQLCVDLFVEIEFRSISDLHRCESHYPELVTQKKPIELDEGSVWPEKEQISTLEIQENISSDSLFFYSQDFFVKYSENVTEFELEIELAQKFIDQHFVVPVVEILEFDVEYDSYDASEHKAKDAPKCEVSCQIAGHRLYNSFTIDETVPAGTLLRIWLYQNPSMNPVKFPWTKEVETCVNFALNVRILNPQSTEHEDSIKENLYCEHTRYLPRNLNRLRYLGEENEDSPQQDFDYIEHFRVDNLKHTGRETKFVLKERTVVRIDGVEHDHLQFFIKILQGKKVIIGQETPTVLPGTENYLYPSVFTVLEPGEYSMKIIFLSSEAQLLRLPCQSVQLQLAMNRADQDYLYPREHMNKDKISELNLENILGGDDLIFQAKVLPVSGDEDKFQILFDQVIMFEEREDLHMAMKVASDFMRADVTFLLTNLDEDHHYMPQHIFEDGKKMVLTELPPGFYRLVIFMQNVENAHNTIFQPVIFQFNLKLFSFFERDETFVHTIELDRDEELAVQDSHQVRMPFSTPEKLQCYAEGRRLPAVLTQDVLLHETDFEFMFTIYGPDLAYINDKHIIYNPEDGEDILRIQINNDVKSKLYVKSAFENDIEWATPIAVSHDKLGNNVHELVARNLDHRETYLIQVIYSDANDIEEKAEIECLQASMQVKIATSQSEYACLDNSKADSIQGKQDNQKNEITLSYKNLPDKGKHLDMVSAMDKRSDVKAPIYTLVISEENTDMEVTIEGSNHLFGSRIQLIPEDQMDMIKEATSLSAGRAKRDLLKRVLGNSGAIVPAHISSPKHMTKYRFMDLEPGRYVVRLTQPSKPGKCINVVDVLFQVNQSLDSVLVEKFTIGKSQQLRFQSKQDQNKRGSLSLPTSMPVQLDSIRFMGGGASEDKYVLFSDMYMLNDDESRNEFRTGKLSNNDTYVRVYVEDADLGLKVVCNDTSTGKEVHRFTQIGHFIESHLPVDSQCAIGPYHVSKEHLNRRIYLEEQVRITVMVANKKFFSETYMEFHKDGVAECPTNQWPLALAKNIEVNTNSDEQSYYNYPLVRYPVQPSHYVSMNSMDMNSYYFRLNETQRFYFEVGSNFIANHAVLKLSPTQKSFGFFETFGRQQGNINVIDQDLPPGDYQLSILAYRGGDDQQGQCGLFSFRGILNMHSAMSQHLPGMGNLMQDASTCEILNSEEAPGQIFANESKTRKGNEAVIDPEGNFFRYYPDLLIVKSHSEALEPWTHEILLEVQETSFLNVIMKSAEAENMMIKVYQKSMGTKVRPAVSSLSETNSFIAERKTLFKLEANKSYMLELEFSGDIYDEWGDEKTCSYFDLIISINSLKSMAQKLSCNNHPTIRDSESLLSALPGDIGDRDLPFAMDTLYSFKYPDDFKQIQYKQNGKQSMAMMLPSVFNFSSPFSVDAKVAFDVHMADFQMDLISYTSEDNDSSGGSVQTDGLPNYEVVARSSPISNLEKNDDETFLRHLHETDIVPDEDGESKGQSYMLTLEERQATYIFNEVAKQEAVDNLCLPFIFKLKIKKSDNEDSVAAMVNQVSKQGGKSLSTPSMIDFKFFRTEAHVQDNTITLPFNVPRITAAILLTQEPTQDQKFLKHAFFLAFHADEKTLEKFSPANVEVTPLDISGKQVYEVKLDYLIDLSTVRKQIAGAEILHFWLEVNTDALHTKASGSAFTILPDTQHKLDNTPILIEFPEDFTAKHEEDLKQKGKQVRDSLFKAIDEMDKLKKMGKKYPKEVEDKLMELQERGVNNVSPDQLHKFATTISGLSSMSNWAKAVDKEDSDVVPVKCACVNGECDDGESNCSKCYKGWHGRMCDIADSGSPQDKRKKAQPISDDDEDEQIFSGRKRKDADSYEPALGRRSQKNKVKSDEYKPRQEYAAKGEHNRGMIQDADEEEDYVSPNKRTSSNSRKATLIEDDDVHSSHSTFQSRQNPISTAQTGTEHVHSMEGGEGFFSKTWHLLVWIVTWIIKIVIAIVALLLLKAGCEWIQEKVTAANQKKRKGKRKRLNENEDGMDLGEQGIRYSDSGEEDDEGEQSPIEMTAFNRKTKDGLRRKRRQRKDSDSTENSVNEDGKKLQLFDQDDEEGQSALIAEQPQDPSDYNPFDENVQMTGPATTNLLELDSDVAGQAVLNEIDDALSSNDDDDNEEFGQFV